MPCERDWIAPFTVKATARLLTLRKKKYDGSFLYLKKEEVEKAVDLNYLLFKFVYFARARNSNFLCLQRTSQIFLILLDSYQVKCLKF